MITISIPRRLKGSCQSTYENQEYDFAFDYPVNWQTHFDPLTAEIEKYIVTVADPLDIEEAEGRTPETLFRVNVSDVRQSLNPTTMQVEADTIEDYAQREVDGINEFVNRESLGGLFGLEEGGLKNTTISLAGGTLNAGRVQYIMNYQGEQSGVTVLVFIKDDKVYSLTFLTDPLKAPQTLPISERIIQSFRFL